MNDRLDFLGNTMRNLDVNVINFFHDIIEDLLHDTSIDENQRALEALRNNYARKIRQQDLFSISFEPVGVRAAYLFRFCPSFIGAVASSFVALLRIIPQYLDEILSKNELTISCLGGGPGTEILGICLILQDILLNYPTNRATPLIINAVVIDIDSNWRETTGKIICRLQDQATMLQMRYTFLEQDLTQSTSEELRTLLNGSDIVTMIKFLSVIHGPRSAGLGLKELRSRIIQDVCQSMQGNAVLFYLDSAPIESHPVHPDVHDAVNSNNMETMYGPSKEIYRMSDASMTVCQEKFMKYYGPNTCCNQTVNRVCFWRKNGCSF